MTSINFGGFSTIGGKTVSNGLASGLDSASIVNALVDAKKSDITKIEDEVKLSNDKIAAFTELKSLITSFEEAANVLRAPSGFSNRSNDIFQSRQVYLTTNASSPANTYVGISAANGADIGNYKLTVTNIAVAKSQLSESFTSKTASVTEAAAGTTASKFSAGTFQINGEDITINEDDSLLDIEAAINAVSSQTNVKANIIQVSDTDFRLNLYSTKTGTANAYSITDSSGVLAQVTFATTSAEDAGFTFNGIPMTRSSNIISDVINNVTFTLYQETPALTSISAEVTANTDQVKSAIDTFIGAYNDLKIFVAKQTERDESGQYVDTATLGSDKTLSQVINEISYNLNLIVSDVSNPDFVQLSDIGITFTDYAGDSDNPATTNILTRDETALTEALNSNFDDVKKIFAFDFYSTSASFGISSRSNKMTVNQFTIDIDTGRAAADIVRLSYIDSNGDPQMVNADYTEFSGGGGSITGQEGTPFEGMVLVYSGDGTDTSDITYTQGIADRIYNSISDFLLDDGIIQTAIDGLNEEITDNNEEIDEKNAELDEYRDKLLKQYAAVETAVQKVNSILQFLDAQNAARESANR